MRQTAFDFRSDRKISASVQSAILVLALALLILPFVGSDMSAQGPFARERYAIHLRGGLVSTTYDASFNQIEGSVDCGLFEEGDGTGLGLSLGLEIPIAERLHFGFVLGYRDRGGVLSAGDVLPVRDTTTGAIVNVPTTHELDATLSYLELQPELRYTVLDKLLGGPLRVMAAPRFVIPFSSSFEQREVIDDPALANFRNENGLEASRIVANDEINSVNGFGLGLTFGLENMIGLNENLHFTQQFAYDMNLGDVTSDADWSISGFRIEAGLRFAVNIPEPEPEPIPEPEPEPEPIPEPEPAPVPVASLEISKIDAVREVGNELLALAQVSVVNAVFFPLNSSEIPARYALSDDNEPVFDHVSKYRLILPDVARMLKDNPAAGVTLRGSSSDDDENNPSGLARARAEAVRTALINLGVDAGSIRIVDDASPLPAQPSNQDFPEGREENRRVDITLRNAPQQTYVNRTNFSRLKGDVTVKATMQNFSSDHRLLVTSNLDPTARAMAGSGELNIPFSERITGKSDFEISLRGMSPILSKDATAARTIDVNSVRTEEVELSLEDFQPLLRFPYNSSVLGEENETLLRQMVRALPAGRKLIVYGSADRLGSAERNRELATERAQAVEQFLTSIAGTDYTIETRNSEPIFPLNTPEGRFLNRSIRIEVK